MTNVFRKRKKLIIVIGVLFTSLLLVIIFTRNTPDKNINVAWFKSETKELILFNAYEEGKALTPEQIKSLLIEVDPDATPVDRLIHDLEPAASGPGRYYAKTAASGFLNKIGLNDRTMENFRKTILNQPGKSTHIWTEQWTTIIQTFTSQRTISFKIGKNTVTFNKISYADYYRHKPVIDDFFATRKSNPVFPHLLENMETPPEAEKTITYSDARPNQITQSQHFYQKLLKNFNLLLTLNTISIIMIMAITASIIYWYLKINPFPMISEKLRLISDSDNLTKAYFKNYTTQAIQHLETTGVNNRSEILKSLDLIKENLKYEQLFREAQQKYTELEIEIRQLKTDHVTNFSRLQYLQDLENYYQLYRDKIKFFLEEGFLKDQVRLTEARERYWRWKNAVLALLNTFDNELVFKFSEILEKEEFGIVKDKRMLTFPIDYRDRNTTFNNLQALAKDIESLPIQNLPENLYSLASVHVRTRHDFDYRLDDANLPGELHFFLKEKLNTILLFLKQLDKVHLEIMNLSAWILENEKNIFPTLATLNLEIFLDCLFDRELPEMKQREKLELLLAETEKYLHDNFKLSTKAETLALTLEKKYFNFLNKTLFRIVNGLLEVYENYKNDIDKFPRHLSFLTNWGKICVQLVTLCNDYIKTQLHLEPIPCKRADEYNENIHTPYDEAEPDPELKNNRIKKVINRGFQFDDTQKRIVIKPVDVIVVKNH